MVNREGYLRNVHRRHELSQAITEMKTEKWHISGVQFVDTFFSVFHLPVVFMFL